MASSPIDDTSRQADCHTNFLTDLLLLQELHGIIGFAISRSGIDEVKVLLGAELATLGLKLSLISPTLYQFEQIDTTVLGTFGDRLDKTLVLLNKIVSDDLATNYKYSPSSKTKWPRLILLHDIIASRYKAIPAASEDEFRFSDEKLCLYLVFDLQIAEQDDLLSNLSDLNHDLDELLAVSRPRGLLGVNETSTLDEEDDDDVVLARQAQEYRQQISSLYKILSKSIGICQKEHMAQLCLSNFGIDKNTLDIYISLCCEPTDSVEHSTIAWHPTKCSKKESFDHAVTSSIDGSLCQYLHTARAKRLPAALAYFGETLSEDSVEVCRLPKEDLLWSFVDLATVLDEASSETKSNRQIGSADKLRLQCLLTQSLLFLHPSYWMPETLELSNIHFTTTRSVRNLKDPYMYCAFQNAQEDNVMPDTDVIADFMIHFGLLLLQIEVGRSLPLSPDEIANHYGHELALDSVIKLFMVQETMSWTDATFENALGSEGSLEFNFPNVAREILPYTIEQHQQPAKVKTNSINPTHKRRADDDSSRTSIRQISRPNMISSSVINQRNQITNYKPSSGGTLNILVEHAEFFPGKHSFQENIQHISNTELGRPKQAESSSISQPPHVYSASLNSTVTPNRPEDYTVGWISAIPIEKAIACEMLDEEYPRERWPWFDTQRDPNSYTFGRLHGHNIVIACLPKGRYGNTSAAVVAQHMRTSFPIRFGLLVGIAGGAPSYKHDIRLGDVVVSSPTPQHSGVIQYDFGRAIEHHNFEETGHMTPPPEMLLNALANLEAQHKRKGHRLAETIDDMLARNKRLKAEYIRPAEHTDRLYKASYKHHEQELCACQVAATEHLQPLTSGTSNILTHSTAHETNSSLENSQDSISIFRNRRAPEQDDIIIHHGLIASANRLMKDADARDVLVQKYDVLCFEMEAAGLVNSFPCVVIRGICDYSDSHKNDVWQGYAAANAAAYAKELLEIIPSHHAKDTRLTS